MKALIICINFHRRSNIFAFVNFVKSMIEFVFQSGQNYKSIFYWKEIIFGTSAVSVNWTYNIYRDLVNICWSKTLVGLCFVQKKGIFSNDFYSNSNQKPPLGNTHINTSGQILNHCCHLFYLRLISSCNSWKMLEWLNCRFHSVWFELNDLYLSISQFISTFVHFLPPDPWLVASLSAFVAARNLVAGT